MDWRISADALDANGIPVITRIGFIVGAVLSLSTILWSIVRVPKLPLGDAERRAIAATPLSAAQTVRDLIAAIVEMPLAMRQLAVAMLFQWYAMFAYWQYTTFAVVRSLYGTADAARAGFRQAALVDRADRKLL